MVENSKGVFNQIKKHHFSIMLLIFVLSLSVAVVEQWLVFSKDQEINNLNKDLILLESIISADDHLYSLFWISWGSGVNVEAERGDDIKLDRLAGYSFTLNLLVQQSAIDMCNNLNRAQNFTNETIDCSVVGLNGLPDISELNKISTVRLLVNEEKIKISNRITELEKEKDVFSSFKNTLYLIFIILSGLSGLIAYKKEETKS